MKFGITYFVFGMLLLASCEQVKEEQVVKEEFTLLLNDSAFNKLSILISSWDISIDSVESVLLEIDTLPLSDEEKFRISYLRALCLISGDYSNEERSFLEKMILRYTDRKHQPILYELLAKSYFKTSKYERAVNLFEKAAVADSALGNTERFLKNRYNEIACLSNIGSNERAIGLGEYMQDYCKIIGNDEWYREFRFVLSAAYVYTGNANLALKISRENADFLLESGELSADVLIDLSHILEGFKLYDNAIDTLKIVKKISLSIGDSDMLAMYYNNIGAMYLGKGENALAWSNEDS